MFAWLRRCRKCNGTGFVMSDGPAVPYDRLTDMEKATVLLNGGTYHTAVKTPCPKGCNP